MIDICAINTECVYQIANPDDKISLLDIRQKIVLYTSQGKQNQRRGPQGNLLIGGRVSTDIRLDAGSQLIAYELKHRRDVRTFGLAIHQNDHQARRRFVEWAQNKIAVVPDFHKRILFSDEAHFWLNGYVNKQNCCIWSEANPQVFVETPLHPEKLTVWCALWAGEILLQKR
ncbi:uncharacterized protein TNCV_808801 [Trichonephila clavipes]|nr:uncharacterized protein TNCV_808801 [Trichonephila clavipes]